MMPYLFLWVLLQQHHRPPPHKPAPIQVYTCAELAHCSHTPTVPRPIHR